MRECVKLLEKVSKDLDSELLTSRELNMCIKTVKTVIKELKHIDKVSITWDVEAFEQRAAEEEQMQNEGKQYNRKKFQYALELMIKEHDCNNGITWHTVDQYLDDYCLLK